LAEGIVRLGLQVAAAGTYTLSMNVRGEAAPASEDVWLIDNEEHTRTLVSQNPYTFTAEAGTHSSRFIIAIGDADPTAITDVETATPMRPEGLFNLSGQRISQPRKGIVIVGGRKVVK
jgi:hypothetical protein